MRTIKMECTFLWYGCMGLFTNRPQTVDWVIVEQRLPDWYQLKQTIYITVTG